MIDADFYPAMWHPEHTLTSQLLAKIQTNSRILNQQEETANKSQAVQLDTKHISKVYECLVDPNNVELELSNGSQCERQDRRFHGRHH